MWTQDSDDRPSVPVLREIPDSAFVSAVSQENAQKVLFDRLPRRLVRVPPPRVAVPLSSRRKHNKSRRGRQASLSGRAGPRWSGLVLMPGSSSFILS